MSVRITPVGSSRALIWLGRPVRRLGAAVARVAGGAAAVMAVGGLTVAVCMVTSSTAAVADPGSGQTERISFAPGTDHATVHGTAPGGDVDRYVLWAAAGQTMSIQLLDDTTPSGSIGVFAPDGTELCTQPSSSFEGRLPANGDYTVTVGEATDITYTLEVRIPAAHRIQFAPGTDQQIIAGSITDASTDRYVLWAAAGQTMTLSGIGTLHVSVAAPDGSVLPGRPGDTISYQLPYNGDYVVEIIPGMSEQTEYSITFSIPPRVGGSAAPRRVQFAPGTDHDTLTGSLADNLTDRYALWAAAGQTMTLSGIGALHVAVTAPDGSALPGGPGDTIDFQLPATGDYVVEVSPGMAEATDYSISVTIPPLRGATTEPQRVEFAAGTDNATITGSITDSAADRFVLRAAAGQTMRFEHVEPFHLAVRAPDGSVLPGGPGDTIEISLPTAGDYVVEVLPGMGEGSEYSITVTIPPLTQIAN